MARPYLPILFISHPHEIIMKFYHKKHQDYSHSQEWPGLISPIEDQGWCSSSWALATAAVAGDRYHHFDHHDYRPWIFTLE